MSTRGIEKHSPRTPATSRQSVVRGGWEGGAVKSVEFVFPADRARGHETPNIARTTRTTSPRRAAETTLVETTNHRDRLIKRPPLAC